MELNTELSNQDFPPDFQGHLVIVTPNVIPFPNPTICQISYSKTLSDLEEWQRTNLSVYPNPTQGSQLFIKRCLLKHYCS
jgi:hypothetical protein